MIAGITVIFGLDINKSIITGFVSSVLGASGATITGKIIVSNVLKLIPGAGTIVGGAISGSTAALLTTALGEAYIALMEAIYNGEFNASDLNTDAGKAKMKELFKQSLKAKK